MSVPVSECFSPKETGSLQALNIKKLARKHPGSNQTFFFAPFGHEFRPFWLFEIRFLPVFGDFKGPFRAEDENSPLLAF